MSVKRLGLLRGCLSYSNPRGWSVKWFVPPVLLARATRGIIYAVHGEGTMHQARNPGAGTIKRKQMEG